MNIPYFDAHCDTLSAMFNTEQALEENNLHVDLKRGAHYVPRAQFFAMFADLGSNRRSNSFKNGTKKFQLQLQLLTGTLLKNRASLALCRGALDLIRAEKERKTGVFLSVEGAELLNCDLWYLEMAHRAGVRMLGLTWNYQNALSGSHAQHPEMGLTALGKEFVLRCEELGIIVDVSHLSPRGFWDVTEVLEIPFVASHSNSAKIWNHSRNLTNAQFLAIKRARGVCGINLYADFLGENPDIDTVIAHIEHFLSLGGEKCIAIGADFDGCDRLPAGIEGVQDVHKIAERLLQKNFPEALIYDIFYNNLKRVVGEICVT